MAGAYGKVSPGGKKKGSPVNRADFVNDTVDAIDAFKASRGGSPSETPTGAIWNTDLVKVRNLTGDDRERGEVVQLGDFLLEPDSNGNLHWRHPWFEGKTVANPSDGKIAILKMAARTEEGERPADIVLAQMSGICSAWIDVSDPGHKFATPAAGSYNLASAASGPIQILSDTDDEGEQELFVLLAGDLIETRIVTVDDGTTADGDTIAATGGCIWPGLLVGLSEGTEDFCSNPWTTTPTIGGEEIEEVPIWITPINNPGGSGTSGLKLTVGDRYIGRYLEDYTLSGDKRPLYAIRKSNEQLVRFELYTDLNWGVGTALAHPMKWNAGTSTWIVDSATTISIYDPFFISGNFSAFTGKSPAGAITAGCRGWCEKSLVSGQYEIVWMETRNKWCRFTLGSQLKFSDTSQSGCTVTDTWQGNAWGNDLAGGAPGTITVVNDGQFYGPQNATGYACWDDNDNEWNIVWVQRQARFAYVTLTANMASGSSSAATVDSYWDGLNPGSTITVNDPKNFFKRALTGAKILVTFNEHANSAVGQYETVEGFSKAGAIAFKLSGAMSSGSATATLRNSTGQAGAWGTQQDNQAPTGTITVSDPGGASGQFQYCPANAVGTAIYDAVNDKYWIITCQYKARWIRGTISSLTSGIGNTASMTVTKAIDGISPGSTVTVKDTDGVWGTISTTSQCSAIYNPDDDTYYIDWVQC